MADGSPPALLLDGTYVVVEARAMSATWALFQEAGPRQLVVSGVVADRADLHRYRDALGIDVRCVLLTASPTVVEARLRSRDDDDRRAARDWHLARHADPAARLQASALDGAAIATDDRTPRQVARAALAWLDAGIG